MVITAARHYWNASLPLINQPIERELLSDPITLMLEFIADVTDKDKYKKKDVRIYLLGRFLLTATYRYTPVHVYMFTCTYGTYCTYIVHRVTSSHYIFVTSGRRR